MLCTFKDFKNALDSGIPALRKIPKGDRHMHALLSAKPEFYAQHCPGFSTALPERFDSLFHFLDFLDVSVIPHLAGKETFFAIIRSMLERCRDDGVVYCEPSFDSRLPLLTGGSLLELIPDIQEIFLEFPEVKVVPEFGIARELFASFPAKQWQEILASDFFKAIDIYGNEAFCYIETFEPLFSFARERKLNIKLHTGEASDGQHAVNEIIAAQPDAVQHGVTLTLEQLSAVGSGLFFHVCPWSNYYLSVKKEYRDTPLRAMLQAGARPTIATDDIGIFGRDLSTEYYCLYEEGILTAEELYRILANSLQV